MEPMRGKLTLAERIVTARRRAHATQFDVAKVCQTTRQQVGKWERGTAIPDLIEAIRLALYTRTPLEWFTEDLVIDLSDQDDSNSTWNTVEQLDLFSLSPQAADMRAGGVLWEFSDRSSVDTPTSDEDAVNGLVRQLVA